MSDRFNITLPVADYAAQHFALAVDGKVATITLNRPDRKNPLTFESYAELRDLFRALQYEPDVKAIVLTGAGGNFCSGGDVFEIIKPLLDRDTKGLMEFTQMTGDAVKAMRACPQPIVSAIDGVCVGAGAILAMASDMRLGTADAKVAFLFNRVGLAGCDMGACAILPAHHRTGPRVRTPLHGPRHGRRGGRALGLLQPPLRPRRSPRRGPEARRPPCRRPHLRQRHHQEDAAHGVGDGRRRGHRPGGHRAGALHADRRLRPCLPTPSPRRRSRCSRATDVVHGNSRPGGPARRNPVLALLRARAPRVRREDRRLRGPRGAARSPTITTSMAPAARW